MTLVTLRPDSTLYNDDGSIVNAATVHAALADDDINTFIEFVSVGANSEGGVAVGFANPTLPGGAVVSYMRARFQQDALSPGADRWVLGDWPEALAQFGFQNFPSTAGQVTLSSQRTSSPVSATQVNDQGIVIYTTEAGAYLYAAYLDVYYATVPVANVTAPTGTLTTTNRPTLTWTRTLDADGGLQTHYEVKVFSAAQYGAGGFNPSTSMPMDGPGIVASPATSWQVGATLADGAYRAYVRVAQTINGVQHWSDWDFEAFTIDVVLPAVPTLTLTPNSAGARVLATLFAQAGDATTDALELQRATPDMALNVVAKPAFRDGGILPWGQNNVTGYASVIGGKAYQTCPGTNAAEGLFSDSPAGPGTYQPSVEIALVNGTAQLYVYVGALDSSGNELAEAWGVPFTPTLLAQRYSAPAITAPAGTVALRVVVANQTDDPIQFFLNSASSQVDYFDGDTPGAVWLGAELASPSQRGEWLPVRHPDGYDIPVPSDFAVVYDYEAPNGQAVRYRLRALHDYSGLYAASDWIEATTTWESTQWWLKHPLLPSLNVPVEIASYPDATRAARQGLFQPLGAALPVAVSDTRGGETGTVVLQAYSLAEQGALNVLLDLTATLLLQGPVEDDKPDRYIRVGDHGSVRVADKSFVHVTHESLQWTLVALPEGAQAGDQYAAPVQDDSEELVIA